MRQNERRKNNNRRRRSEMRTEIKRFRQLLSDKKVDDARAVLKVVYAVIDRTAQHGVIHSNTAARYKSRLARHLNESAS
jgi:small subunit ribosomal protein S20